jgi:hypothetical protein
MAPRLRAGDTWRFQSVCPSPLRRCINDYMSRKPHLTSSTPASNGTFRLRDQRLMIRGQRLGGQRERLAGLPHVLCETTNLAVDGTVPVRHELRLQIAPGRRGEISPGPCELMPEPRTPTRRGAGGRLADRVTACPTPIGNGTCLTATRQASRYGHRRRPTPTTPNKKMARVFRDPGGRRVTSGGPHASGRASDGVR